MADTETPTPDEAKSAKVESTLTADEFAPAPANVRRVSGTIDDALAARLYTLATSSPSGVTTTRIYPGRDDAQYKADVRKVRLHLMSRINTETQRVAIVVYAADDGSGIKFAAVIKAKGKRKPKSKA